MSSLGVGPVSVRRGTADPKPSGRPLRWTQDPPVILAAAPVAAQASMVPRPAPRTPRFAGEMTGDRLLRRKEVSNADDDEERQGQDVGAAGHAQALAGEGA